MCKKQWQDYDDGETELHSRKNPEAFIDRQSLYMHQVKENTALTQSSAKGPIKLTLRGGGEGLLRARVADAILRGINKAR